MVTSVPSPRIDLATTSLHWAFTKLDPMECIKKPKTVFSTLLGHFEYRVMPFGLTTAHFEFALTYCPGSKNTKLDALSRQFATDQPNPELEPTLPLSCVVDAEERVREALALRSGPWGGLRPTRCLVRCTPVGA